MFEIERGVSAAGAHNVHGLRGAHLLEADFGEFLYPVDLLLGPLVLERYASPISPHAPCPAAAVYLRLAFPWRFDLND